MFLIFATLVRIDTSSLDPYGRFLAGGVVTGLLSKNGTDLQEKLVGRST